MKKLSVFFVNGIELLEDDQDLGSVIQGFPVNAAFRLTFRGGRFLLDIDDLLQDSQDLVDGIIATDGDAGGRRADGRCRRGKRRQQEKRAQRGKDQDSFHKARDYFAAP